ncbi:integrase, catalytic region, zinc finger, CCHC-type containing protein [Tanacetum coccineum]
MGEMRRKRVPELSAPEKLQYEADVKATNIILQGVPADVYALDLHVTNFDKLFAHLEHHEAHANEIYLLKERSHDLLALQYSFSHPSTPQAVTYQSNAPQIVYQQPQAIYQIDYQPQQTEFPALNSSLAIPVFNKGDDPIDVINKMMSFLSIVVTSCFPSMNNQLRNSSNPRQQVTIQDGRVTVQRVQGRQNSFGASSFGTKSTGQRVVKCFNCQGEGHMAKQCPKPKRKKDASWFQEKVFSREHKGPVTQYVITQNTAYQDDDLDAYDSDFNNVKLSLISDKTSDRNIFPYSQFIKSKEIAMNLDNKSVNDTLTADLGRYKEQVKVLKEGQNVDLKSNDIILDSSAQSVEIDHLKQTLSEHLKEKESLMQTDELVAEYKEGYSW